MKSEIRSRRTPSKLPAIVCAGVAATFIGAVALNYCKSEPEEAEEEGSTGFDAEVDGYTLPDFEFDAQSVDASPEVDSAAFQAACDDLAFLIDTRRISRQQLVGALRELEFAYAETKDGFGKTLFNALAACQDQTDVQLGRAVNELARGNDEDRDRLAQHLGAYCYMRVAKESIDIPSETRRECTELVRDSDFESCVSSIKSLAEEECLRRATGEGSLTSQATRCALESIEVAQERCHSYKKSNAAREYEDCMADARDEARHGQVQKCRRGAVQEFGLDKKLFR